MAIAAEGQEVVLEDGERTEAIPEAVVAWAPWAG